jgi:hypothetical protein
MKLDLFWNGVFFMFENAPQRTELFSVERAKDRDWCFSKIRNNVCVTICGPYGYLDSRSFNED